MALRRTFSSVGLFVLVCAAGPVGANGPSHPLPRAIGAIRLDMSLEEFQRTTGVEAGRCVHCAVDELEADLYLDPKLAAHMRQKLVNLRDARIDYQRKDLLPEHVVCFFYEKKLYSIVMNDVKDTIAAVRSRYESALGTPTGVEKWDTGYSQIRWQSKTTLLTVTYDSKETGIDHLTIDYTDQKIQSSIPQEPNNE